MSQTPPEPTKKTILVVEDDADSRSALCAILEALGYIPLAFGLAKDALKGIPGKKIDLALLDIMMPEMDGYELLREMKKMPEFQSLPVIMVTARDDDGDVLEGYRYGADYYICKPFTSKQLEKGIALYLSDEEPEA